MSKSTQQSVLFEDQFDKPVHVVFDAEAQTSDAGLTLLAATDKKLGLTRMLASQIEDSRQAGKVRHEIEEMLRQRTYAIAAGYEDANDTARIGADPALKLACGRGPVRGADLASQSTLSRFENKPTGRETIGMLRSLEAAAVRGLKRRHRRASRIVIDLDPSVDPAHGAQQGVLFNGFYGTWCYLPIFGFLSVDGDPEHYLFCARLRPGTAKETRGVIPMLRRMVAKIRIAFGRRQYILVRLDAGYANPRLLDELEELGVKYVVGLPNNAKLNKWAKRRLPRVRRLARESGESEREFDEKFYATRSWPHERRVILKAEAIPYAGREMKNNPRFVVTNLHHKPERVYRIYCGRGDAENRIKELKCDLSIDRTSCTGFVANQVRVVMTAAAYLLFQELRWQLRKTELRRAQVGRLRTMLLKVSARVVESTRRIVFHLPTSYAFEKLWRRAAHALGASRPPSLAG
ncbi:MAG: IS1380 family transposase [Dehalococcoidia bacterium]